MVSTGYWLLEALACPPHLTLEQGLQAQDLNSADAIAP